MAAKPTPSESRAPASKEGRGGSGGASRSARRRAREYALQGLYEWLVGGQDAAAIEAHLLDREGIEEFQKKADLAHFREVLHGAIDHAEALRGEFGRFIDRNLKELSPVEHAILLIGCYELKHRAEIPYRVVINEAVELAKGFGGTEGFKYVNGVLDKVAAQVRPEETRRASRV